MSRAAWRLRPGFGILALLVAQAASAASPPGDWIQVVRATDAGLELVLRAPELERRDNQVRVPGFDAGGEPGMPVVYECATTLGVPGPSGVAFDVVDEVREELNGVDAQRVPFRNDEALGEPAWASLQPSALAATYPTNSVEVTGTAILRGRHVVVLRFRPLQYKPGGRATYTREAHVRITFRDAPAKGVAPVRTGPLHAALLNAAAAARWPLAGSTPRSAARSTLPDERLRIRIARRGVYALRGAELLAAGVPLDSPTFDPRTLRIYFDTWHPVTLFADSTPASWQPDYEMREAAIWVPGEEDGAFDPLDDRIVFYALGPEGYEDLADPAVTDSLAHFQHPYDRNAYAWLVWGGAFGQRMQSVSAAAPEPLTDPLVTRVRYREHVEVNRMRTTMDDLWSWERISSNPRSVTFGLDLGDDSLVTGDARITLGSGDSYGYRVAVDFHLNGQPLERVRWLNPISMVYAAVLPSIQLANQNELRFIIAADETPSQRAELLELDATWQRTLVASADGSLAWSSRPVTDREVYELNGFATEPLLFDVTEAFDPVRLVDPTPVTASVWRARAGRGVGERSHYLAVAAPDSLDPGADLELRVVPPLRARATSPDVFIVTHESTRAAAERLAAHRAAHFPGGGIADVLVTTTRDIYDNFSGGRLDPLAIRNYVKFLYNLSQPEPRLRYVVLFGDATYDPRQLVAGTPATLVPALYPLATDSRMFGRSLTSEDWFGEMDTPRNGFPTGTTIFPVADLAVGRLPVGDPTSADRLVDRIVAYETTTGFGRWRGRLLSAADDECHSEDCYATFWVGNNETLLRSARSDLDVEKLYLTEYGLVQRQKPHARRDFIRAWSEGAAVVNWNGHGAIGQLADEVLLLATDVPALTNGQRLPLFLQFGERAAMFDRVNYAGMGERMLASPSGGAIGVVSSSGTTYVGPSFNFNLNLFRELFDPAKATPLPLGLVLQAAKVRAGVGAGWFNETYMLLGDPVLALGLPGAEIEFDAGADTLVAGRRAHVEGFVHARGDSLVLANFNGTAEVEVLGSADETGYTRVDPSFHLTYDLPGAPLFRGTVPVMNGRFALDFTVPAMTLARGDSLRVSPSARTAIPDTVYSGFRRALRTGPKARLSVYATSASLDAKGARNDVFLKRAESTGISSAPPRIAFRFPSEANSVPPGTAAAIEIRDENGIAIAGDGAIRVQFDDRSALDVTAQFRCTSADTLGTVAVTVPTDLEPGVHRATVFACDNLGNPARATFEFTVASTPTGRLANVIAFPNPFRDRTHIFFDLDEPGEVEVSIHTISGREVWRGKHAHDAGRGVVAWPGVDFAGERLANGTYIYRLVARPSRSGSSALRYNGKVVVMR